MGEEQQLIQWIRDHPQLFYKGLPVVFVTYLSFPILLTLFSWLPWIWTGYGIYQRLPPGTVKMIWKVIRLYLE